MNDIAAPFRQLVERRLWPLAVLLIAALVAIPMMLAKGGSTPAAPPAAVGAASAQGETQPIVSLSEPGARDSVRKVLGSRKNPFRPAIKARKATKQEAATTAPQTPKTPGEGTTAGGAPATPGTTPVAPTTPTVVAPVAPAKTYELYSLQVRFGDSASEQLAGRSLKRLTALPSTESAALIYLGLLKDRKTAVFLVDGGATVQGDGRCRPSPDNCQTLEMKRGDTAFVDMPAEGGSTQQFQLDLVKIRTRKTTSATAAKRSYASVAKGGREALRARVSRVGELVFDGRTGLVSKRRAR